MPAIGNIVLADGLSTPVNHTFSPVGINADMVAFFDDRSAGIALGYNNFSASVRKPTNGATSRNFKVSLKFVLPTLEVTSPSTSSGIQPAPTKAYDCLAALDFVMPERCTLQNRKDLRAYVRNALAHASVISMIEDLEGMY